MEAYSSPQPIFLNVEYLFFLVIRAIGNFFSFIFSVDFLESIKVLATIIVILLIALILYLLVRLIELNQEDKKVKHMDAQKAKTGSVSSPASGQSGTVAVNTTHNPTWEGIRAKLLSENQSEWRLAIIEADIYLDRLLDDKGFHGETTSDKLKQITPADLASIQIAWEAHKVRNQIAHQGAAFSLSQPEARRVLSYFEIVFRDLGAIM